jgi:hypothetical protein
MGKFAPFYPSALPDSFRMNNEECPEKGPDGDDDPLKRREVCSKTPEIEIGTEMVEKIILLQSDHHHPLRKNQR